MLQLIRADLLSMPPRPRQTMSAASHLLLFVEIRHQASNGTSQRFVIRLSTKCHRLWGAMAPSRPKRLERLCSLRSTILDIPNSYHSIKPDLAPKAVLIWAHSLRIHLPITRSVEGSTWMDQGLVTTRMDIARPLLGTASSKLSALPCS